MVAIRSVIIVVLFVLVTVGVHAQEDADYWYFAVEHNSLVQSESRTIYAFQPNNVPLVIGTMPQEWILSDGAVRVAPDRAVAIVDSSPIIYVFTPERIVTIDVSTLMQDVISVNNFDLHFTAMSEPYMVFSSTVNPARSLNPLIVVNTITGEASRLADNGNAGIRFSQDNTAVRYIDHDYSEQIPWSLVERNLETGEERRVYTASVLEQILARPNTHGDSWIIRQTDRETNISTFSQLNIDGTIAILGQVEETVSWNYTFWGNALAITDPTCLENCVVTVIPSEGESISFTAPFWNIDTLSPVDAQPLVVTDNYWLVWVVPRSLVYRFGRDGQVTRLGYFAVYNQYPIGNEVFTSDSSYVVLADDFNEPDVYSVMNYETLEILHYISAQPYVFVRLSAGGIIVLMGEELPQLAVLSIGSRVVELPVIQGVTWNTITSDNQIVYGVRSGNSIREETDAILALNLNSLTVETVLENATMLYVMPFGGVP